MLNYEAEQWNAQGTSYVWVQLPELSATNNYIWACWGSPAETNPPAYTTNGATWSEDFRGVFHLHATNGSTAADSTAYRQDGALQSMADTNWVKGWIGNALHFNGTNQYVKNGPAGEWASTYSVSMLVVPDSTTQPPGTALFNNNSSGFQIEVDGANPESYQYAGAGISQFGHVSNQLTYLTVTFDGLDTRTYNNGVEQSSLAGEARNVFTRYDIAANMARNKFFAGLIDELRIENVARSSNWIWATWMNLVSNSAFSVHESAKSRGTLFQIDADGADAGAPLAFVEPFDVLAVGELNGNNRWSATPAANALVQTNVAYSGTAARIRQGSAWHGVQQAAADVWVDWHARPVRGAAMPRYINDLNWNTTAAFYIDAQGHVVARSNTTWVTFSNVTVAANAWARFSVHLDYTNHTWSLYTAGPTPNLLSTLTAANLPFSATSRTSAVSFRMADSSSSDFSYLDNLSIGSTMPLSVDNDSNGLPDRWETVYLGGTGAPPEGDADGDGVSNRREYLAGTHPAKSASRMRIIGLDIESESSSNLVVRVAGGDYDGNSPYAADAVARSFGVQAANNSASAAKVRVANVTDAHTGTYTWTDLNAAATNASRYYNVSVSKAGQAYTNSEEWAAYMQPRLNNTKYLVSVPVNVGTGNNLNSTLGVQLARGMHAGANTNDSDFILHRTDANVWKEYYLLTNLVNQAVWWDYDTGTNADLTVTPGMGFWMQRRGPAARARTNCVMIGQSFTSAPALHFATNSSVGGWTWRIFGWPYATPKRQINSGIGSTVANQLGMEALGYGGRSGDETSPHANQGDQIWVWENNTFRDYYWLMDGVGTNYDGRWWSNRYQNRFPDIILEPGKAYFYRHHTSRADFDWTPSP